MNKSSLLSILIAFSFIINSCTTNEKKEIIIDDESKLSNQEDKVEVKSEQLPTLEPEESNNLTVMVSETKDELNKYYEIPFIKEFYEYDVEMEYVPPRDLVIPEDLSTLSYGDLRLLRNEVFARNGYLFGDGFLRGYFNKFSWYRPIFDVDTFKVIMNKQEQKLVNDLIKEEAIRKEAAFIDRAGILLQNADLVVNKKQFRSVDNKIVQDLKQNNFSIIDANRQMPFYVYDNNSYQYIPHYITTDLYLFILHKYFSRFLEKMDENYLRLALKDILMGLVKEINDDPEYQDQKSKNWVEMYVKTALFALSGVPQQVSQQYSEAYLFEEARINGETEGPVFIPNQFVNYTELKPRGHYTKSEDLKRYFKAFKWISLNGIDISKEDEFKGMVTLAYAVKSNSIIYKQYKEYTEAIEKLAGQEDNVSIRDIIESIKGINSLDEALSESNIAMIKSKISKLNKERVKAVFGANFDTPERDRTRIYFLSSTYSVSGEIFSKLIHVDGTNSKRPFPNGLDIPAVFGNQTAQDILINELKSAEVWPKYSTRLDGLQNQFQAFEGWDSNYGVRGLKTALTSTSELESYPEFMKTDAYNRKELNTMLSSWTHIKHDLILYQEKPYAAEAGQGGGPEPPQHYSYVEPNIEFWNESLKLAKWFRGFLHYEGTFGPELNRIIQIGTDLRNAADKQLKDEKLTKDEHLELSYIGGRIEYTLLGLLETDHLPEREKSMALIADVYSYNDTNLNVAVGHADDIYVLVPINNEYHIARGAVFSYYEFQDSNIYNDEEWRRKIRAKDVPDRPTWMRPLINNIQTLEGQMEFRYSGYGSDY